MSNKITLNPSEDFKDNYKILIGSILPRPISVISTINEDGSDNLAPFSFFTACSAKPMIIAFAPMIKSSTGEEKDTLKNIRRSQEFVVNYCTEMIAQKVNLASTELPYGQSEFEFAKLSTEDSELIKPKRLKESPINLECKLRDILSYGDQPGCGSIVTGEVVKIHIDQTIFKDGKIITDLFKPIGRGTGNDWIKCDSRIQMERLMASQIQK